MELGNRFFRVLIDKQAGAIVEAFNLSAESHRTLNLVETTPEDSESWKKEGHTPEQMGYQPVPGVPKGNVGWTSLGGSGPITRVDVLEAGPLRGRVRLVREGETWELSLDRREPCVAVAGHPGLPLHRRLGLPLPAVRPVCRRLGVRVANRPGRRGTARPRHRPEAMDEAARADTPSITATRRITGRWASWRWTRT